MKARRFDFYPDDWLAGTVTLEPIDRGIYITAVAAIYSHGGPIPETELRRLCPCDLRVYKRALDRLLRAAKLVLKSGYLSNKRCLSELQKSRKRVVTATQEGRKGGLKTQKINRMARDSLEQSAKAAPLKPPSPSPSPSPLRKKQEREGAPARGSLSLNFKVSEEWKRKAHAQRSEAGLPEVNLTAEAIKFSNQCTGPPTLSHWLNWALNAHSSATPKSNGKNDAGYDQPVQRSRPSGPPPPIRDAQRS